MKPWHVDATTSSNLDSRQVIERDTLGQWDLIDPETGRKKKPIVIIERVESYVPAIRKKKRMPDGRMVDEPLNKLRITLKDKKKVFVCNQVNRKTIESMYGTKLQGWIGQKIQLLVDDEVRFGKTKTGGLRVSSQRPDGQAPVSVDPLDESVDEAKAAEIAGVREEFGDDEGSGEVQQRQPGED